MCFRVTEKELNKLETAIFLRDENLRRIEEVNEEEKNSHLLVAFEFDALVWRFFHSRVRDVDDEKSWRFFLLLLIKSCSKRPPLKLSGELKVRRAELTEFITDSASTHKRNLNMCRAQN